MFLGQGVHYYMVYIAYFTELNLQICEYAQKRRICRRNCKYAIDENFHGHFCPRRKAAKFCHPALHPQYSILHPHYLNIINPPPPSPPPPPISSSIPTRFSQKLYFYTPSSPLLCDKNISLFLQDNQPSSSPSSPSFQLMSPIFAPTLYIQGLNVNNIKSFRTSTFVRS